MSKRRKTTLITEKKETLTIEKGMINTTKTTKKNNYKDNRENRGERGDRENRGDREGRGYEKNEKPFTMTRNANNKGAEN